MNVSVGYVMKAQVSASSKDFQMPKKSLRLALAIKYPD